jgi:hypothetical protein
MKTKRTLVLLISLAFAFTLHAQLKVTSDGKVKINSNQDTSYSSLLIGNTPYGKAVSNVGVSASTNVTEGKNNIGVIGSINANSQYSNDKNYGVIGVVSPVNYGHGRNYGLCGMIGFSGEHYGGAGIYATNYTYFFSNPTNIQGTYAGYFVGPVNVSGYLTATGLYIPTDSKLNRNTASLNESKGSVSTLDKLLTMNVIEYNIKSNLKNNRKSDAGQNTTEADTEAYKELLREEQEMASRRHFGIDAEELKRIYPDLVLEGQDGNLAVNYVELVPILIRSIQELKAELDEVKGGTSSRRARSLSIEDEKSTDILSPTLQGCVLYQNNPNPFKEQTVIRFKLANNVQNASICIFDMAGKMLKKIPISSEMDNVSVGGYELGEGMFLYSLIANGQVIATKRMVITK